MQMDENKKYYEEMEQVKLKKKLEAKKILEK